MDKPKILIGLTYYLPNISGVSQYVVILAEELVKRKYEVEVVCSKHQNVLAETETINGVKINRINGFSLGKGFLMPSFPWKTYGMVKKADTVIVNLPSVESWWLAIWAKLLSKKLVVIHHCEFNFKGPLENKLISLLTYKIHFLVYFLADEIVSYTRDYAKTSIFLRFFKNKIRYILPPIKVEETTLKLDFGKSKVVGFVGRIGWEKGLTYLIEAMKEIEAKLILVGPYKEVIGDTTYEKIKKNKEIVFYGPLLHKDVKAFYKQCDCLVLPSTNNLETFGIVQAEAMICGTPVVASNLPGVRVPIEMTKMGEVAMVANRQDLAKKINLVLKNGKKYYQKMATNLNQFDYRLTVNQFEKILKP